MIAFCLLNPNLFEFLRYLCPFLSYRRIYFKFFNSAPNSAQFFWIKNCFF
jgi:hypothetical protein